MTLSNSGSVRTEARISIGREAEFAATGRSGTQSLGKIFLRPSGARHHGHVGWAFSLPGGGYLTGGVEMPNMSLRLWQSPAKMGFWSLLVENAESAMSAPPHWERWNSRYDLYKDLPVETPDTRAALREVKRVRSKYWRLIGQNCMDATYEVLTAFGVSGLPIPTLVWGPIQFFNDIDAPAKVVKEPIADIDITLYGGRDLSDKRYSILDNFGCPDLSEDDWENTAKSAVVRSGYIALYKEKRYRGKHLKLSPGRCMNFESRDGHFETRSIWVCERDFDPEMVALNPVVVKKTGLPSGPQKSSSPDMPHSIRGRGLRPRIDFS